MHRQTPSSFVEIVRERAADPDRLAYSFMSNAKRAVINGSLSYGQLDTRASRIAAWLVDRGVRTGDRVLLLFPPGLDFVTAFMGSLYAGTVAVPAYLPELSKTAIDRTAGILRDADVSAVLSDAMNIPSVAEWLDQQGYTSLPRGSTEEAVQDGGDVRPPRLTGDSLAFLQYTSGSTSEPKGVMVTHANLLSNLESIRRCYGFDAATRSVSWLPMSHDMGLIGVMLNTTYVGAWTLLVPPTEFVRRPIRWLELIDQFDANFSAAPNFAYDLCLRKATDDHIAGLDLSRWEKVINGAEPVRARTITAFTERFAPAGFRATAFVPSYGLAEATLMVAAKPKDSVPVMTRVNAELLAKGELAAPEDDAPHQTLVSCGPPAGDEVLIVDPDTAHPVADGQVGEIWVRGGSVGRGYWRQPEISARTFDVTTCTGETGFLRTGDLGAMKDGELYVTGRLKDVLIVRGRNLYPQDLESAAQAADEVICSGSAAAFTLADDSDEVVIVQEIRPGGLDDEALAELAMTIRSTLVREFGVASLRVVLARPGTVRKTTSGKVRRSLMRQLFLDGALTALFDDLTGTTRAHRVPAP